MTHMGVFAGSWVGTVLLAISVIPAIAPLVVTFGVSGLSCHACYVYTSFGWLGVCLCNMHCGRFPFSGCVNHGWLVHIEYAPLDILVVYLLGPHRFVYCVVVSHVLLCVSPLFHGFFFNIMLYNSNCEIMLRVWGSVALCAFEHG